MTKEDDDSWLRYQKLVLEELESLDSSIKELAKDARKLEIELAILKVKAGLWGGISGAIIAIAGVAAQLVIRK